MKDMGRYAWDGVDTSTSNPERKSTRGTVAPRSVVMLPTGEVVFCDHEGVWIANVFDYGEKLLSDEIGPTWVGLNHGLLSNAAGVYFDGQYLLSVTDSGGTANNLALVYDFSLADGGGWLAHDIGATAWESYIDSNGVIQLICGDPSANSRVFRRYKGTTSSEFNFNGASYRAVWYSKEHDFKEIAPEAAGKTKIMLKESVSFAQKADYNAMIGWRKNNDVDFITALWNLLGAATTNWSNTPSDAWSDTPASTDVWEGEQKVEGLVPTFKVRGRTLQQKVELTGTNQPFIYYGSTIHFIPLRGFS